MFWSVVHFDPVDQIFLDPVTAPIGILRLDAGDGLIEIEPFAIGPDELAFSGVELHVLDHIAQNVGESGKLLALRRMPPGQEVIEEGIGGKDVVLQRLRMLVVPFAHENFSSPCAVTRPQAYCLVMLQGAPVNPEMAVPARKRARAATSPAICRQHREMHDPPIMRTDVVNGL